MIILLREVGPNGNSLPLAGGSVQALMEHLGGKSGEIQRLTSETGYVSLLNGKQLARVVWDGQLHWDFADGQLQHRTEIAAVNEYVAGQKVAATLRYPQEE